MFKTGLLLLSFALLCASASAEVLLVAPFEKSNAQAELTELGKAMAGERIELIFSSASAGQAPWERASAEGLPEGWSFAELEQQRNRNTIILQVLVPKEARNGTYQFYAVLENSEGEREEAEFLVFVQEGLLKSSVDSVSRSTKVGEPVTFTFSIDNDSIAKHSFAINSTLPLTWFEPQDFEIGPKSSKKFTATVTPKNYGEKKFTFSIVSGLNKKTLGNIVVKVNASPTLKSKYEAAMYGFPFFTPSLLPYYWFNSLISQLA